MDRPWGLSLVSVGITFRTDRTAILDDNGGRGSANRDDDGRDADNRDSSGDNYSGNRTPASTTATALRLHLRSRCGQPPFFSSFLILVGTDPRRME
jgi:hypothetical protein